MNFDRISRLSILLSSFALILIITCGSAIVFRYDYSGNIAAVQTPSVTLQSGNAGTSSVSTIGNSANVTVEATLYPYYVPITLTNSQTAATPSTFQQKITFNPSTYANYEASDLGNIRFCADSACATELYAWLESCTPSCNTSAISATVWVKLTSSIGSNGGNITIFMVFQTASIDFDGNYWGEAPNLSSTYGQYDNGANVFSFYDDFAGSTISSAWNTIGVAGSYSVNDGLTIYSNLFPGYSFSLNNQYTGPLIVDAYEVGTAGDWIGASFSNLQTASTSYNVTSGAVQWVYPPQADDINGLCIASGCTSFTPSPASTTLQVVTLAVNSTTATEYQDYANPVTASGTISLTNYPGLAQVAWNGSDIQTTYWFRLRAYPPNNVMPSVAFGNFSTDAVFDYVLVINNPSSYSWNASLGVASSSNTGRLYNFTVWLYNPTSVETRIGSGVSSLTAGPEVTLTNSSALKLALFASSAATGTSVVTLSLIIQAGSYGPYSLYTIVITIN